MTDHDPKPLIERQEAFRRAERALNEFGPVSFFEDEKVGAVLEALRFYCDTINHRSAVPLWDQALAVAERLHAQRVASEAEHAARCAAELERREMEADLGPYCHECGNDDRERLACVDNYANGTKWRCEVCGHEFLTAPKPREE